MMDSPKTNILLGRLGVVYGPPNSPDPLAFLAEYARIMQQYTDSELEDAADRILRQRTYKTWPPIAECVAACEDARSAIRNRMQAATNKKLRSATQRKPMSEMSEAELAELHRFVDDCADGRIELGFCAKQLRQMAITMRARRRAGA